MPTDSSAARTLRRISEQGYPRRRRLWNRLRWSRIGRWLRGI
jgi:hypothetical protein